MHLQLVEYCNFVPLAVGKLAGARYRTGKGMHQQIIIWGKSEFWKRKMVK